MSEVHADAAAFPVRDPRGQLRDLRETVEAFLTGSEHVFLDAGRRIAGLEQRARALIEAARSAGALKTKDVEGDPATVLGRELRRMDEHLRASRGAVDAGTRRLGDLVAQIEILLRTRSHFESIPPTLRMLGLNTRIENARSSTQYAGMETVALEVRRLGDGVEPKFHAVFQQAAVLLTTVQDALHTADRFLHGDVSSADMLARTHAALESLQAMTRAGGDIAERAVAGSERLAQEVGALVVALQGHDATRQALEHVVAELATLEAEADEAGGHLAEVARVTSAQVRGARERFVQSLDDLSRSLRAVSSIGAELSRETARFVESGSGASAAAMVRQGVDRTTHCLLEHVAHETRTGEAMRRVVSTVEEMGRAVKDIQGIGTAVKIIALNALVETERAGQSGRVLAVLAQGIGALAGEVVQRTGAVSATLGEISGQAAALRASVGQGTAGGGEAICAMLEQLSVRLSEIQRGLEAAVGGMLQGSRTLGQDVEAVAARVAEARADAARLDAVEAALAQLAASATPDAAVADAHEDRAYARYTMESERAIHDRVVRGVVHPAEPIPIPSAGAGVGVGVGVDGLGENVELF